MIYIEDKRKCVGCSGCATVCPTQCIKLEPDLEGFLYPIVDVGKCIDCSLCERVCPVLIQDEPREPMYTYAAVSKDAKIRANSSSGGLFSLIAEEVISSGGIVFGAVFNDKWEVVHAVARESSELAPMRGSKYVQSDIGESFKLVRESLDSGVKTLFTGTQCQVAGLRRYLRKEYANLICVDVICHGVPSPEVFKECLIQYVESSGFNIDNLRSINFRDKRKGWRISSFVCRFATDNGEVETSQLTWHNTYMKGFFRDIYLRPSCYDCPSKRFKSGSDLSIADLWGAEAIVPELDDDKGVSLIFVNSEVGRVCFDAISSGMVVKEISLSDALVGNPQINTSTVEPKKRKDFFDLFGRVEATTLIFNLTEASFVEKVTRRVVVGFKRIKNKIKR